jgi:hypothetical protein
MSGALPRPCQRRRGRMLFTATTANPLDRVSIPSPLEPSVAKIQIANQLNGLGADLQGIEPNRIVIEWMPT